MTLQLCLEDGTCCAEGWREPLLRLRTGGTGWGRQAPPLGPGPLPPLQTWGVQGAGGQPGRGLGPHHLSRARLCWTHSQTASSCLSLGVLS